ncbi:MAG TPA: DUF2442 domain-containing protein [Phycisphaerae bacterium]|nr:DUF2442 domain-containing protein [Phycisphaerae bacterium]
MGGGIGVHWETIDEDISVEMLLALKWSPSQRCWPFRASAADGCCAYWPEEVRRMCV